MRFVGPIGPHCLSSRLYPLVTLFVKVSSIKVRVRAWRGQGRHQSIATVGCPRKVNSDGPRSHLSPGTTGARRSPVVVGPNPLRAMWPSCQARGVKVKDATSPRHSASTAVCLSPHLSHSA